MLFTGANKKMVAAVPGPAQAGSGFVGESVAIVLTAERYQGEDAAELVDVEFDPLPVVDGTAAG